MLVTPLLFPTLAIANATFGFASILADSGDICTLLGFAVLGVVIIWSGIVIYNQVNPLSHQLQEAEANIEVAMQKRNTLANALLDVAERYAGHEKVIHFRVSKDRRTAGHYQRAGQAIVFVAQLAATTFPALKADQTYLRLMDDLRSLESELQSRYETYNGHAREYNAKRASFPAILFADILRFPRAIYLDPSLWHPR